MTFGYVAAAADPAPTKTPTFAVTLGATESLGHAIVELVAEIPAPSDSD